MQSQTSVDFIEPSWRESTQELLIAINTAHGKAAYRKPRKKWQPEDIIELGNELLSDRYEPSRWFSVAPGTTASQDVSTEMPEVLPNRKYRVLNLEAKNQFAKYISMRFGGVVFDDPFYFLLACYDSGHLQKSAPKIHVLPVVSKAEEAWRRRRMIVRKLYAHEYRPDEFFTECEPIGQSGPSVSLFETDGTEIASLRELGLRNLHDSAGLAQFVMYDFR